MSTNSTTNLIFILDDNEEFRESTAWLLEGMGYEVRHFGDCETALSEMQLVE